MKFSKIAFAVICLSHLMMAQQQTPDLSVYSQRIVAPPVSGAVNLKILAVMVQFQPDNDRTTIGNGQFDSVYTKDWGTSILDPLPHDSAYFAAHLQFAKNYYAKVSSGNVNIEYTVLPQVVTLSKTMREYSPPIRSTDFSSMISFYEETWQLADALYPGFDFSGYNLFCVFHAGVGRDVSLPGSLGNERDLPSVYIGLPTLREYKGSAYNGVPVSNGTFNITNSMVLPQTQNREFDSFSGKFLIELTINGLIVSSIGSHLGLPDLFDTETGLSAIGRFGLMDGQSIFAYNGVFPPEPSAWEKKYLGWINPKEIFPTGDIKRAGIKAPYGTGIADTALIEIPISGDEYYLVENRLKNPKNAGLTLTIWNRGNTYTKFFAKDTSWFNSFTVDSLEGVIIDASHFDWALPGSGILVWHIDEQVIREKRSVNKINTNKERRGVDLEEADGIQDIGVQFTTIFGDVLVGEGDEYDLWYAGNTADLYTNEFSARTRPNTKSNTGANSWIKLDNFFAIGSSSGFDIQMNSPGVKLVKDDKSFPANSVYNKTFSIGGSTVRVTEFNVSISVDYNGSYVLAKYSAKPYYYAGTNNFVVVDYSDSSIYYTVFNGVVALNGIINLGEKITAAPVYQSSTTSGFSVIAGLQSGKIQSVNISFLGTAADAGTLITSPVNPYYLVSTPSGVVSLSATGTGYFANLGGVDLYSTPSKIQRVVPVIQSGSLTEIYIQLADNTVVVLEKNAGGNFSVISQTTFDSPAIFIPSSGSEGLSAVAAVTSGVTAKNKAGSTEQNFPVDFSSGSVVSNIVSADVTQDGESDLFLLNGIGQVIGINGKSGGYLPGFPVAYAANDSAYLCLQSRGGKIILTAVSKSGRLTEWEVSDGTPDLIQWSDSRYFRGTDNYYTFNPAPQSTSENLNKSLTYNYPNPVYEGFTYIRYFVSEDSRISIRIFDLAGNLAAELSAGAQGGVESETKWDVSSIQSGVYLASVEAVSSSGKKDSKIIKIAVVK